MVLKNSASLKAIQEEIDYRKAKQKRHTLSPSISMEPLMFIAKDTLDSGTPISANDSKKKIVFMINSLVYVKIGKKVMPPTSRPSLFDMAVGLF